MLPTLLLALVAAPTADPTCQDTNTRLTNQLRDCPSDNDPVPFLRTPRLDLIGPCRDVAAGSCGRGADAGGWSHVFHRAARFTQPRFGQCREPLESDGLVIYEGMKLTVSPATGVYDLTFAATAPPTTVTVRLQLHFANPQAFSGPGSMLDPIRLTLPPITIEPDAAAKPGDSYGPTLRVNHRGFSELFRSGGTASASSDLFSPILPGGAAPPVNASWRIVRAGTARFGAGLPSGDDVGR